MVVKLLHDKDVDDNGFESSVISYGSKTETPAAAQPLMFESSVISYGSKTITLNVFTVKRFESSVISYGSKTRCNERG